MECFLFWKLSLPLLASEVAFGSEVSLGGEVGKLKFTLCEAQYFTMTTA